MNRRVTLLFASEARLAPAALCRTAFTPSAAPLTPLPSAVAGRLFANPDSEPRMIFFAATEEPELMANKRNRKVKKKHRRKQGKEVSLRRS